MLRPFRRARKSLKDIAQVGQPDTILGWYRQRVARKFHGSRQRGYPGRPRLLAEVEELVSVLRARIEARDMTESWPKRSFTIAERTVARYLRRLRRRGGAGQNWLAFLRNHREVIAALDFFTVPTVTFRLPYCFWSSSTTATEFCTATLSRILTGNSQTVYAERCSIFSRPVHPKTQI